MVDGFNVKENTKPDYFELCYSCFSIAWYILLSPQCLSALSLLHTQLCCWQVRFSLMFFILFFLGHNQIMVPERQKYFHLPSDY